MPSPQATPAPAPDRLNSAVEQTCASVVAHVASGRWPGGFPLIEAELMQQLQVSRSTVREALRRLESDGMVLRGRSRNLVVRRLSRRDVSELYELREVLEGHAARLAAMRLASSPASARQALKAAAQWWGKAATRSPGQALSEANVEFHRLLHSLSGNSHLPRLLGGTLMALFVSQFRPRLSADAGRAAAQQHVGLAQAILAGDADAAERLMRQHVRHSAQYILELSDDAFDAD